MSTRQRDLIVEWHDNDLMLRVIEHRERGYSCGQPTKFPRCDQRPVFAVHDTMRDGRMNPNPLVLFCYDCAWRAGWMQPPTD